MQAIHQTIHQTTTYQCANVREAIEVLRAHGAKWAEIAAALNELGHRTAKGRKFTADSVRRVCR